MDYRILPHGGEKISVIGLDAKTSLFNRALTHTQCFQYALEHPAVMTVLPVVRNEADLRAD